MENIENSSIIIVDDEQPILSSLKSLLRKEDYDITIVDNPKEAIGLLFRNKYDIIISDMRMPEINGIAVLEKAAEFNPNSFRIILSGYEDKNIVFGAIAVGYAHAYMLKPWEDNFLKDVLKRSSRIVKNIIKVDNKDFLGKLNSLPVENKYLDYIKSIINNEDVSIEQIAKIVEESPGLLSKILHLANSVYIGVVGRITSAKEAIHFLGLSYVLSLLSTFEILNSYYNSLPTSVKNFISEWLNIASNRAKIFEKIIPEFDNTKKDVGLISCMYWDLALLIEACLFPEQITKIQSNKYLNTREKAKEIFGENYFYLATLLLEMWNFPESIIHNIKDVINNNYQNNLVQLIILSDMITLNIEINDKFPSEIREKYLYLKSKNKFN